METYWKIGPRIILNIFQVYANEVADTVTVTRGTLKAIPGMIHSCIDPAFAATSILLCN